MDALPFAVAYGWAAWPLLLVAAALFGAWLPTLRGRRLLAQRRKEEDEFFGLARELEEPSSTSAVVIKGTLATESDPIEALDDGSPALVTGVASLEEYGTGFTKGASGLHLEIGSDRVELDGEVNLRLGSRELLSDVKLKRLPKIIRRRIEVLQAEDPTRNAPVSVMESSRVVISSLRAGDTVRVEGYLRREAGDGEKYRDAASRWSLSGSPETDSKRGIDLKMAFDGTPQLVAPVRAARIRSVISASFVLLFALWGVGKFSLEAQRETPRNDVNLHAFGRLCIEEPFPIAGIIAAMTPFHRTRALQEMAYDLSRPCGDPRGSVNGYVELRRLLGDCTLAAEHLLTHGEPARAEAIARACDEPEATRALFALGLFEEAASRIDLDELEEAAPFEKMIAAQSFLVAGQWREAREAVRMYEEHQRQLNAKIEASATTRRRVEIELRNLTALQDALLVKVNDEAARSRLKQQAEQGAAGLEAKARNLWLVGALAAQALEGEARLDLLEELDRATEISSTYERRQREELLLEIITRLEDTQEQNRGNLTNSVVDSRRDEAAGLVPTTSHDFQIMGSDFSFFYGGLPDGLELRALELYESQRSPSKRERLARAALTLKSAQLSLFSARLDDVEKSLSRARQDIDFLLGEEPEPSRELRNQRSALLCAELLHAVFAERPSRAKQALSELHDPEGECGTTTVEALEFLEKGTLNYTVAPLYEKSTGGIREGWRAASKNDSAALADVLLHSDIRVNDDTLFWLLRTKNESAALKNVVRWGRITPMTSHRIRYNFRSLAHEFYLARASGNDEWAEELEPVIERYLALHREPDLAIMLHALDVL